MSGHVATTFADVPIAAVRDYWDKRPCNVRHSAQPLGSRAYFDEVEQRKSLVEPHIPAFADFARWRDRRVLEIGCGLGTDTMRFARAGADVTAVDLSGASLKLARDRAAVYGLEDRVRFVQGDAESLLDTLPGSEGMFDLVYSFGVVHHTPHPERAMAQVARLTRPGGTVKIMVYHHHSWKVLGILLRYGRGQFWRLRDAIAAHSEAQTGCPVTYTYTRRQAERLFADAGLTVDDMQVEHIFPYRIPDYVEYRYVREWYFRVMPPGMFRWLETRAGWHLCITGRRVASAPGEAR